MHITCQQTDLARGLVTVGHAIASRSTLPILANILLSTDQGGRLKLSATNLEIGITCWVDAEVLEEGTTTVPAKLFTELVKNLPEGPVALSLDGATPEGPPSPFDEDPPARACAPILLIQGPGCRARVRGLDPAEYPQIAGQGEDAEPPVELPAPLFKEMIEQVAFAAADDESRPVLCGVLVQISDEHLTFAAADAFRLAVRVADLPGGTHPRGDLLIPARTLRELAHILPAEGPVEMIVTPTRNQVLFHTPNLDLVSRLIEGTYPNFRAIIPKAWTTRAVVDTKELAAALRSASLFARENAHIARVKIDPAGEEGSESGAMTIEATAEDVGDNVSTVHATVDGPEIQAIFSVKYLADVLAAISTDQVALEVVSGTKPGVLRPVGENAPDAHYVIMPMQRNR